MKMKSWKTISALVLAFVMLLTLCACGSNDNGKAAVGSYRMTKLVKNGLEDTDIPQLASIGIYMYLVLNEDGTGYTDMMGEKDIFRWNADEIWDDESEPTPYTYANGTLSMKMGDEELMYIRLSDEELAYYQEHGSDVDWDALFEDEDAMRVLFGEELTDPEYYDGDDGDTGFTLGAGGYESKIDAGDVSLGPVTAEIDDFTVTILCAEIVTANNGEPAMRFWYDFTNNSDELACVFYDLSWEAMQDGLTLNQAFLYDDVPEAQNSSLMVAPGYTIRCADLREFDPNGGPVAFQLSGYYGDSVTYYADPQDPGSAPADEFVMVQDGSIPVFMEDAATTDGSVEVLGADLAEDFYGDEALRVRFRFTNNTDEDTNCFIEYNIWAMQDGYEISYAFTDGEDEDESNDMEDIAPGESIEFTSYWTPRTDSPIAIVIKEGWGYTDYFGDIIEFE